jgi:hypothetical protein
MRRRSLFVLAVLSAALPLPSAAAARAPMLWSASQRSGHVLVTFSLGDLAAGKLVVATSPRRNSVGALVRGVQLREKLMVSTTAKRLRWLSRHTLQAGVYFVQVSGIEIDGVVDCTPPLFGCGQKWSNVLRVVVRSNRQ